MDGSWEERDNQSNLAVAEPGGGTNHTSLPESERRESGNARSPVAHVRIGWPGGVVASFAERGRTSLFTPESAARAGSEEAVSDPRAAFGSGSGIPA